MRSGAPAALMLLLALAAVALVGRSRRPPPAAAGVPAERARRWMLEALPGIGPRTAPAWTARLRREGPGCLPPPSRGIGLRLFRQPATAMR